MFNDIYSFKAVNSSKSIANCCFQYYHIILVVVFIFKIMFFYEQKSSSQKRNNFVVFDFPSLKDMKTQYWIISYFDMT
jgi:hypothetical protein